MKHKVAALLLISISIVHAEVDQEKIKELKSITLKDGTLREWTSINRFTETGFSYVTASGGGSIKYSDLPEEVQKEIGFDPKVVSQSAAVSPGSASPTVTSAQAGSVYDQALKQNTADQQSIRSDIAQLRAEIARSRALNPSSSTSTLEIRIARKEGEIRIMIQQARVIQEQKKASLIGANVQQTGNPQVDGAVAKVDEINKAIAQKKIKKETILVQIIQAELQNQGNSIATYQKQINYIDRDLAVLEAEMKAAQAAAQAARAAVQAR